MLLLCLPTPGFAHAVSDGFIKKVASESAVLSLEAGLGAVCAAFRVPAGAARVRMWTAANVCKHCSLAGPL